MGAVEHHVDAVQAVRERSEQVHHVAVLGVGEPIDATDSGTRRAQLVAGHGLFDALLDHVGKLAASAGEDLDPVVGRSIVRRRDHHAEVGVTVGDEECERGRRNDSRLEHVDSGGGETCGDGRGDEVSGDPGVSGDHCGESLAFGLASLRSTALAQDDSSRLGQGERQVGGEDAIGESSHTVRAKDRHRSS